MKQTTGRKPILDKIIDDFVDQVHRNQKCYWASDLISKGLTQGGIRLAIRRAMDCCAGSGMDINLHFQLKQIGSGKCSSFSDCKLSKFGYLLTVINANPNNTYVAQFQKQMLVQYVGSVTSLIIA